MVDGLSLGNLAIDRLERVADVEQHNRHFEQDARPQNGEAENDDQINHRDQPNEQLAEYASELRQLESIASRLCESLGSIDGRGEQPPQ